MENRSQFTFYESFYHALRRIKKKADRADAYDAICAYALFGTEPDMDALSDAVAIAFSLVKPNLEASRRKAVSGKKGGLGKQTTDDGDADEGSKLQANAKQSESKKEKEKENKIENKKENEIENECYHSLYPSVETEKSNSVPTLEQVEEYATMRNSTVSPKEFFDYYSQGNWQDAEGKPVYHWQQKFIAWELRDKKHGGGQRGTVATTADAEAERMAYEEDFERMGRYLESMLAEQCDAVTPNTSVSHTADSCY